MSPVATEIAAPQSVLVVEDTRDDLELFATYLASAGFKVMTSMGREDTLAAAWSTPSPNAILIDLVLGRDDGLEIVQALREDARTASTPIVAITAAVPRYLPEVARKVGCDDFLTKPCPPDVVEAALRDALERSRRP